MVFIEKIGDLSPYSLSTVSNLSLSFSTTFDLDYDGDGDNDRIFVLNDGSLQFGFNTGAIGVRMNRDGTTGGTVYSYALALAGTVPFDGINVGAGSRITLQDVNGDGLQDVVAAAADGSIRYFEQQQSFATPENPPDRVSGMNISDGDLVGNAWNLIGAGDIDGDGDDDILWQHSSGVVHVWNMQNGDLYNSRDLANSAVVGNEWNFIGAGDIDGDGDDDILWQHSSGVVHAWNMQNGDLHNSRNLANSAAVGGEWNLIGAGDIDGDGDDDILWQHSSGVVHVWNMQNGDLHNSRNLANSAAVGGEWNLIGAGDFDGDGDDDILWQHSTGQVHAWEMQNGDRVAGYDISAGNPVDNSFRLIGAGDFDGDGDDDILWQHNSGQVHAWEMGSSNNLHLVISSRIGADTTLALAIASSITSPSLPANTGTSGITPQQLSQQILGSASSLTSNLAKTAVRTSSRVALKSASWALLIGAELTSVILAETGNEELAGYFGSGANPLVDIDDVSNSTGVDVAEVAATVFRQYAGIPGDASNLEQQIAAVVVQTAVNIITSPIQMFIDLFSALDTPAPSYESYSRAPVPSFASASVSANYYNPISTRGNGYLSNDPLRGDEQDFMSVIGSNQNDVLKGRLFVQGGAGDDTLVGRLDTTEDDYFRIVSQRVAANENRMTTHSLNQKYYSETRKRIGRMTVKYFARLESAYYPDPSNSKLDGGTGNDKLFSKVTAHLDGGAGNDYLNTTYYSRTIQGGTGDDIITLDVNSTDTQFNLQSVAGGAGNDHLFIRGAYGQIITLSDTNLQFQGANNTATSGSYTIEQLVSLVAQAVTPRNVALSGIEQVTIAGGNGNDIMNASGFSGGVLLKGGAGNDSLTGSTQTSSLLGEDGNDTLVGGAQGDVLVGGAGTDTLTGNGGADVFLLNTADAAHDTITDFNQGQGDTIVIDMSAFGRLYEIDIAKFRIGSSNGNGEIYYGTNKLATISGSSGSDLQVGQTVIFTEYQTLA